MCVFVCVCRRVVEVDGIGGDYWLVCVCVCVFVLRSERTLSKGVRRITIHDIQISNQNKDTITRLHTPINNRCLQHLPVRSNFGGCLCLCGCLW